MFTQEADAPTKILRRIVPRGLKTAIKKLIIRQTQTAMETFEREMRVELEASKQELRTGDQPTARLKHFRDLFFLAHQYSSECYLVPKAPGDRRYHESSSLPVPPMERWEGYAQTNEHYLASGEEHVRIMPEDSPAGRNTAGGRRAYPGLRLHIRQDDSLARRRGGGYL